IAGHARRGAGPERPAPLPAPVSLTLLLVPQATLRSAQMHLPKQVLRVPRATCVALGGELYRASRLCTACRAFGIGGRWVASCDAVLGRGRHEWPGFPCSPAHPDLSSLPGTASPATR